MNRERWHEPRGAAVRCGAAAAGAAGGQRRAAFLELSRTGRARRAGGRRLAGARPRAGRPGAAEPGKLRRVLRIAVRLLGGRAVRGAGQRPAAPARGRVHRRQFRRAAADRDPGLAEALAPLAGSVDTLDAVLATRTAEYDRAAQRRAAAARAGQPRPTAPGCSTPRARPAGPRARC